MIGHWTQSDPDLLFQPGDDDYDVVPGSKFVVSRTAFKDNTSYYRLNEKKATYKEVAIVLRSNGIDLDHNRFLILQVSSFWYVCVRVCVCS